MAESGEGELREAEAQLEATVATLMRELAAPAVDAARSQQLLRAAQSQLRYLRFLLLVRARPAAGGDLGGGPANDCRAARPPFTPPAAPTRCVFLAHRLQSEPKLSAEELAAQETQATHLGGVLETVRARSQ